MKKILLTITGFVVTLLAIAQSPNLMNYQGVARNAVGNVLPNQPIGLKLSIVSGTPTGTTVYSETRNMTTNAFGLFNVVVGSPGAITSTGTIAGINWSAFGAGSGPKYLKVEIDPVGGTNYVNVGTTQLVSVPYALNANGAAPIGPAGGDLTGTYPNPQILIPLIKTQSVPTNPLIGMTNSSTTGTIGAIQGTSASTDAQANGIWGMISSTSPGGFSTGVRGTNNGTAGLGIGVTGTQNGSGWGVYGTTPSGIGVHGMSTSGFGMYGLSTSGIGVFGNSNTNSAGLFTNTNAASTAVTLTSTTNGVGDAISGVSTGTGRGGYFQVNNAASTADALRGETNGTGASWGVRGISSGTNGAGLFQQTNAANTANNLQSNQAGLGRAGFFNATNAAATADALFSQTASTLSGVSAVHAVNGFGGITVGAKIGSFAETDNGVGAFMTSNTSVGAYGVSVTGFGVAGFTFNGGTAVNGTSLLGRAANFDVPAGNVSTVMNVTTAGTGITGDFNNTNAANLSNGIRVVNENATQGATGNNGGGNTIFARKGAGLGAFLTNPSGVYATSSGANGIGVSAITMTGIASFGGTVQGGTAVLGQTFGTGGVALFGAGTSSATSFALVTSGRLQLQGQGAALNRVLASDAVGNATWQPISVLGGVSGSGTLNFVPKWTPDGATIGNSQLFDNGTNVGLGTTTPAAKFDVLNNGTTNGSAAVLQNDVNNAQNALQVWNRNATTINSGFAGNSIFALRGNAGTYTYFTNVTGIYSSTLSGPIPTGIGIQGNGEAMGVAGISGNTGTALMGYNTGTGLALTTFGRVQIQGQGAALNRVLASDAVGNATWQALSTLGGVSGTGTLNFMPKWTPNGTTLGNSQVFDNGTTVGIGTATPSAALKLDVVGLASQMRLRDSDDNTEVWISSPGFGYTGGIGTVTNHDFPFYTNSIDRMNITAGGLVGIGVANPNTLLANNSTNNLGSDATGLTSGSLNWSVNSGGYTQGLYNGSAAANANGLEVKVAGTAATNKILDLTTGAQNVAGNSIMVVRGDGNVGIGVAAPGSKLQVDNSGATIGTARLNQTSTTNTTAGLYVQDNNVLTGGIFRKSAIYAELNPISGTAWVWGTPSAIKGVASTSTTPGLTAGAGVQGSSGSGYGTIGITDNGIGLMGYAVNATGYALQTFGQVQIQGQGAAAGNVLTSDAAGNATWQPSVSQSVGISIRGFTGSITVPNNTFTPVTQWSFIDNEDGGANFNTVTGTYTITRAGVYQINAAALWNPLSANASQVVILSYHNGGYYTDDIQSTTTGQYTNSRIHYAKRCAVGETINFQLYQNSGVNQTTTGFVGENSLSIQFLHN